MDRIYRRDAAAGRAVLTTALAVSALLAGAGQATSALASTLHPYGSWSSQQQVPKVASKLSPATCVSGRNLYVAYTTSGGGIDYVGHSTKGWGAIKKVFGKGVAPATTSAPAIIFYAKHLYVFWINASDQVRYTELVGKTWTKTRTLSGTWGTAESSTSPSLAVTGTTLWVAWKGHTTDNIYYSSFAGKSWSAQQVAVSDATSFSPTIAPTRISAAPLAFAWTTSKGAIGYGILGFLGFESIGTVPAAGTNAAPALDFMSAAPGTTMYLAWKGTSTDRVFFDEVANFSESTFGPGTWAGQAALPSALTSAGPGLTNIGTKLYALYKGHSTDKIWYEDATNPKS
jgi:hypothetical protein